MAVLSKLKTGETLVGVNQARKAVSAGRAQTVFIADDAERRVTAPIQALCLEKGVEIVRVPTMKALGEACGIEVRAAVAVLLSE